MTDSHDTSGEDSLIARYLKPLATDIGAFGLTDDAAVFAGSDDDIVVTTDAIVEGVHFLPDDPPDTIARKALRVNLSDLAAKGATPAGFVLTLALRDVSDAFLAPFAKALGEDAATFRCPLLGGDTVSTPGPVMISITAFGRVPKGQMVRRSTAEVGDHVVVTGTIGDAALGLALLQGRATTDDEGVRATLIERYRVPQPRNVLAKMVRQYAHAAMDVSDGLAGDLTKFVMASGVSASIAIDRVPLSAAAQALLGNGQADIASLLAGGDDYEILCMVAPDRLDGFRDAAEAAGIAATSIGRIVAGTDAPTFLDTDGREIALQRLSYSHF